MTVEVWFHHSVSTKTLRIISQDFSNSLFLTSATTLIKVEPE